MTTMPDSSRIDAKIMNYLTQKGWTKGVEKGPFVLVNPPNNIGFDPTFSLQILTNTSKKDYEEYNSKIIKIISEIYDVNTEDLSSVIKNEAEVFSVKIKDETTKEGSMGLQKFEEFIKDVKELLFNTAAFTLEEKPFIEKNPTEAEIYLTECRFLQTRKGSFVTRILLPNKTKLRQTGLFGPEVTARQVNDKLFEVLHFTKEKIIDSAGSEDYTNTFFQQNREVINLEVTKSIYNLISKNQFETTNFSFVKYEDQNEDISISNLSDQKIRNLSGFIDKINQAIKEDEVKISLSGHIVSLSVKDVDFERNMIKLLGLHERLGPVVLRIKLTEEEYVEAIDAHKAKKSMFFEGYVRRVKTSNNEFRATNVEKVSFR